MSVETQAASLLDCGYREVTEHGELKVGSRVRHVGEQFPRAHATGTATVERIFCRSRGDVTLDIELIVKRDKPKFGPNDTHGYWANYHTILVEDAA